MLEELVQVSLVLDVVDNVDDCLDGLLPHVMSCVAAGKHQVAHDCVLGQCDGISLGIGGDVGHQPECLLPDYFGAVSEHVLELKHELAVLHILRAGLVIDCKQIPEEADTVRHVLHLELNEHAVRECLQLGLLGDDLDLLVAAVLDDVGDDGQDIALQRFFVGLIHCRVVNDQGFHGREVDQHVGLKHIEVRVLYVLESHR